MKSHLQVKVTTLAAEMTYIRRKELKWKKRARYARTKQYAQIAAEAKEKAAASVLYAEANFWSMRAHRQELKIEARTSHLAYGFLKGNSYAEMEQIAYGKERGRIPPDWDAVQNMIERFTKDEPSDPRDVMQRFSEWRAAGEAWYDGNPDRIVQIVAIRKEIREAMANDPEYQAEKKARGEAARAARAETVRRAKDVAA